MKSLLPTKASSESTGFFLLLALLFVTPLAEAPKNLLIVGLFIWWLSTGSCIRDLHTAPLHVKSFVVFASLPLVSLMTSEITEASDLVADIKGAVKFGMVLLPLYSLSLAKRDSERATVTLIIALAAGGLTACFDAYITWRNSEDLHAELRGVGHVNQSALYMNLVAISGIFLILHRARKLMLLGWFTLIAALLFLFLSRSLNAIVTMICIGALWASILLIERRYESIVGALVLLTAVSLGFVSIFSDTRDWSLFKEEIAERMNDSNKSSYRIHIIRTALEVYDLHLWFGAGPDQFGEATSEARLRMVLEAEGRSYDEDRHKFYHTNHGHNVWTNVLVERGLTGIFLVALFFVASGIRIWTLAAAYISRRTRDRQIVQMLFLASATWTTLFVGGIANTTLHLEHGLVGVMLLTWPITVLEHRIALPRQRW